MGGPRIPVRVKHLTGDIVQDRIDTERDELAGILRLVPFLRGRLVSVQFVAVTDKVVTHRLGVPATCMVVRPNYDGGGAVPILIEATSQTGIDPNFQLRLVSSQNCKLDLWFYPRASRPIDAATGQSL